MGWPRRKLKTSAAGVAYGSLQVVLVFVEQTLSAAGERGDEVEAVIFGAFPVDVVLAKDFGSSSAIRDYLRKAAFHYVLDCDPTKAGSLDLFTERMESRFEEYHKAVVVGEGVLLSLLAAKNIDGPSRAAFTGLLWGSLFTNMMQLLPEVERHVQFHSPPWQEEVAQAYREALATRDIFTGEVRRARRDAAVKSIQDRLDRALRDGNNDLARELRGALETARGES